MRATCQECRADIEGGTVACHELMLAMTARSPDARRLVVRRDFVDAYALQHPGSQCRGAADVAVHLLNMCCAIEHGGSLELYSRMKVWLRRAAELPALEPPALRGELTIADAAATTDLDEYIDVVRRWSRCVWEAWHPHHEVVRGWIEEMRTR